MQDKKPNVFRRNVDAVANPEGQSDEQRRSTRGVLLGVLIGLVVLGLITWAIRVFVFEPNESQAPPAATSQPSSEPAPAPSAPSGSNECELDDSAADIREEPPTAEQWVAGRYLLIPEVAGAGPCEAFDGFEAGFANSMTGAVVAAFHYGATLYVTAPSEGTRAQVEYALVDGSTKERLLQQIDAINNGVEPRAAESEFNNTELLGYQVAEYSNENATIELLGRTVGGGYWSATVRLAWQDGDWRIDPATGGSWTAQRVIDGTSGYVLWSSATDGGA